jgi:hypothetical protein
MSKAGSKEQDAEQFLHEADHSPTKSRESTMWMPPLLGTGSYRAVESYVFRLGRSGPSFWMYNPLKRLHGSWSAGSIPAPRLHEQRVSLLWNHAKAFASYTRTSSNLVLGVDMRTTNLIVAWALLTTVHVADGAEALPPCDPMPAAQLTALEPRSYRPDALHLTGVIIVSVTIAADGAITDAQARINEDVPARFYHLGHAIQLIESPSPAARQRAEEEAKQDALQMVTTARYPGRAEACRGEFTVTFKLPVD